MLRFWLGLVGALILGALSSPVFAQSEAERTQVRDILQRSVAFDTSAEGGQTPAMAHYLADRFRSAGFPADDVHVLPFENTAALLVRYRGDGASGRPILLLAHMDVVPARREEWTRDPFALVEEEGMFFGRGVLDNKVGVAHMASLFLSLRAENFRPTRDLILWFSGDEETTGATTTALLNQHRALIGDAEFALNTDAGGGQLNSQGQALTYVVQTAEKTYASFAFTVRNQGGHSSMPRADNAIYELAEALARLSAFTFPVQWNETTLESFRNAAAAFPGPDGQAMRRFAERPTDRATQRALARNPSLSPMMRTTCVATMLAGGHAENALAQTASATVNCRIFPGVAVADVQSELQAIAGPGVEVILLAPANASDASPLRPDVMAAVTRAVRTQHPEVVLTPYMSAGATDGVFFRAAGIPTYGVSAIFMREEDDFSHGLNERIPVDALYSGLSFWRTLISELAAAPPGP